MEGYFAMSAAVSGSCSMLERVGWCEGCMGKGYGKSKILRNSLREENSKMKEGLQLIIYVKRVTHVMEP